MIEDTTPTHSHRQVIRCVSSRGYGRTRLVLQSVCGDDGRRYLRAVWEYQGEDKLWHSKKTPPEFNTTVWADVIAKAAAAGMLSSGDYKDLLVRLAQGLDSSRVPTPKAFVRFTGHVRIHFATEVLEAVTIDEVAVYESLSGPAREVVVTQAHKPSRGYRLVYEVQEDVHYMEALHRLPVLLRDTATKSSLEEAVTSSPKEAFFGIFGDPGLESAGFVQSEQFEVEYGLSVL